MVKITENTIDRIDKENAVDNALDILGLETSNEEENIKKEAQELKLNVEVGIETEPKAVKEVVLTEEDRKRAVYRKLVPEHYKDARFDENSIKANLRIQHSRSRGLYIVKHFDEYIKTCNEILTNLRLGKLPRRSWIIGAPNGFGKTSFVNECLITILKNGWITAPYISLSELAVIRVQEEQRLMRPFGYRVTESTLVAEYGDYMTDNQLYLYKEGKLPKDIIKNPLIIQSAYSWSEYINAACLFVSLTDVISKDLESHTLYQLLSIRGAKGLPTIVMMSTSLEPYIKDTGLKELVWNEILDYDNNDNYDRVKHVSCYKVKNLNLNNTAKIDKDTGILN